MKVKQALLKYISPSTPADERLAFASRIKTEDLSPQDEVTALFILGFDKDPGVSCAAKKSLEEYPLDLTLSALEERLDPLVIKKIVETRGENEAVQIMAALNSSIDDETLKRLAETGPEELAAALAQDRERLSSRPFLIEALKKNPLMPLSVISSLAGPPTQAGPAHAKKEEPLAPLPKELKDERKADEQNIYRLVSELNMAQKMKLALSGNKSARELLVKDSNKLISISVLKNPRITEDEIMRVTASKGTPEDLLRFIGRNKEWVKCYGVKLGMTTNPKTPLTISIKMLDSLFEKDLQKIAKSKNIPSVLASAARRKLEVKGKK